MKGLEFSRVLLVGVQEGTMPLSSTHTEAADAAGREDWELRERCLFYVAQSRARDELLIENGLLLRADLHRLYDRGYLTVTPDHRVRVSQRLKKAFENGEPYYPLEDREIWLPPDPESRPSREFLEWHEATIYRR